MHLTPEEHASLDRINSFQDMAAHGIALAARFKRDHKATGLFQICGPISTGGYGSIEANTRAFQAAIATLHHMGLPVMNQIPYQDAMTRLAQPWTDRKEYCAPILEDFYRPLFVSGHIKVAVFLNDWQSSHGAKWERKTLAELGITIIEYPHGNDVSDEHFEEIKRHAQQLRMAA